MERSFLAAGTPAAISLRNRRTERQRHGGRTRLAGSKIRRACNGGADAEITRRLEDLRAVPMDQLDEGCTRIRNRQVTRAREVFGRFGEIARRDLPFLPQYAEHHAPAAGAVSARDVERVDPRLAAVASSLI